MQPPILGAQLAQEPHARPHRRTTLQVQHVRQNLCLEFRAALPHADAHWRHAAVSEMRQEIRSAPLFAPTHADAQRLESLQMCALYALVQAEAPIGEAPGRAAPGPGARVHRVWPGVCEDGRAEAARTDARRWQATGHGVGGSAGGRIGKLMIGKYINLNNSIKIFFL